MSGRRLAAIFVVLALVALGLELRRAVALWSGSRLVGTVGRVTTAAAAGGKVPIPLVEQGLRHLETAERLRPADVAPAMYRGSLFLLSGRPRAALRAYEEALALEPRAEVYANLGRAHLDLGEKEAAVRAFEMAILLGGRFQLRELGGLYLQAAGRPYRSTRVPGASPPPPLP